MTENWPEAMAQRLRVRTALPQVLLPILRNHMVVYSHLSCNLMPLKVYLKIATLFSYTSNELTFFLKDAPLYKITEQ